MLLKLFKGALQPIVDIELEKFKAKAIAAINAAASKEAIILLIQNWKVKL